MFSRKLKYLGHVVSGAGVECDPEMIEPVKDWPIPTNVKELQRFLGFANFYRKFVQGFGSIAQPLTALTGGQKKHCKSKKNVKGQKKEAPEWKWGEEQQDAFDKLRQALVSHPVLGYPDFSKPFLVRTDASTSGLGAVLCQDQGDRAGPCVLAYASRSLKPSEKNYSPYKLEFLAMYWAITQKFSQYLASSEREFTLTTDHNPLTYVLSKAKLDAAGHRWLAELMQYNFSVKYKPGAANVDADALSRLHEETIPAEVVQATCRTLSESDEWEGYLQCIMPVATARSHQLSASEHRQPLNWREEQGKDPVLCRLKRILEGKVEPDEKKELPAIKRWLKERGKLYLKDGVLYRAPQNWPHQILCPAHRVELVLTKCHAEMGHQGRDRTLLLCRLRFYWLGMARSVEDFVRSCERCVRGKACHLPHRAPLHPMVSTEPLDLVCMDFVGLESSKGGYNSILVITDHFTKWAIAVPTRNQTAVTVAKALQSSLFYTIGIPRRIHSDQGACFEAKVIKHLCDIHGVQKSRTSPYHPEGDGITERFNRTLLNMLRTLDEPQKENWKSHVERLVHAYNSTEHASTGYSPYFLMHGRHPRLPVDSLIGDIVIDEEDPDYDDFATELREQLQDAYRLTSSRSKVASASQKKSYDKKVRGVAPEVGDLVLVRKLGTKGKHKIQDKYEREVYVIVARDRPDIPVYRVRRDDGIGRERTLHRNHLLPLVWPLPVEEATPSQASSSQPQVQQDNTMMEKGDSSSDEDEDEVALEVHMTAPTKAEQQPLPPCHNSPTHSSDMPTVDITMDGSLETCAEEQCCEEMSDTSVQHAIDGADSQQEGSLQEHIDTLGEEQETAQPYTRPRRNCGPPMFYGDCISHQQQAATDWTLRVQYLQSLIVLYPHLEEQLLTCIMQVVTHF